MRIKFTYIVALLLASVGAAVSLYGLVLMFGVAFLPLGVGLEAGKLTAAASLHRSWATLGWLLRYALSGIVITLMALTSSGIYGFTLTRYLAHVAAITAPAAERIVDADEDIRRQAGKVADLDRQIADVDAAAAPIAAPRHDAKPAKASAINAQASADAAAARQRVADESRRQVKRDGLAARRDIETAELSRLRSVRAQVGSAQQAAEAEVGPVKVLADALGVDPGKVVAAAVASIYDALGVLLLLVAGHRPAEAAETVPVVAAPVAAPVAETASVAVAPARKRKPAKKPARKVARKRKAALKPDWRDTADTTNLHYLVK